MTLSYIRLDERLDAVQFAELRAAKKMQRAFRHRFMLSWLFHELSLEGVVLDEGDLERALAGKAGRDYCDDELLERIRRYREAVRRLSEASSNRETLTRRTLLEYQAIIDGMQPKSAARTSSGATEAYKHDVLEPEEIDGAVVDLLAELKEREMRSHPIELAIYAHYRLIQIWPFERHSAAVARLAANQILCSHGYPPALIHAHDRQGYYHSLHYNISRLQGIVVSSIESQIELRERLFARRSASRSYAAAL